MQVLICILEFIKETHIILRTSVLSSLPDCLYWRLEGERTLLQKRDQFVLLFESHYLLHSIVKVGELLRIESQDLSQYQVLSLVEGR